uniref:Ankyrin repeat protein n=1 Tax=viral metagenome TaxID=1070528 RepID=A0A6C0CBY2_9ZZZZ
MKRQQYPILDQNPEKVIPDTISENFFTELKSGDINKIRSFVIEHKNRLNLIEGGTRKTPFHVVLELNDKIANDAAKLELIRYLDSMGAPYDLPDASNVWPIHLAAQLQNEDIIKFFVDKKTVMVRKDSSNNTPLHYAISGSRVECPNDVKPGDLVPSQKIDDRLLSEALIEAESEIMKILNTDPNTKNDLVHLINTIDKVADMYENSSTERDLEDKITKIFTDVAEDPNYTGDLKEQQNGLELIIDNMTDDVKKDLLRTATNPITFRSNNTGWGPGLTAYEKIMPNETDQSIQKIGENLKKKEAEILDPTDSSINKMMIDIAADLNNLKTEQIKMTFEDGKDILYSKILSLLIANKEFTENPCTVMVDTIMSKMKFMSAEAYNIYTQRRQYNPAQNMMNQPGLAGIPDKIKADNVDDAYLLFKDPVLINKFLKKSYRPILFEYLQKTIEEIDILNGNLTLTNFLNNNMTAMITYDIPGNLSAPIRPSDIQGLTNTEFRNIFARYPYLQMFRKEFVSAGGNDDLFFSRSIIDYGLSKKPINRDMTSAGSPNANKWFAIFNPPAGTANNPVLAQGYPLFLSGVPESAISGYIISPLRKRLTYIDIFRIFDAIRQVANNINHDGFYSMFTYITAFDRPFKDLWKHVDEVFTESFRKEFPLLIVTMKIFYKFFENNIEVMIASLCQQISQNLRKYRNRKAINQSIKKIFGYTRDNKKRLPKIDNSLLYSLIIPDGLDMMNPNNIDLLQKYETVKWDINNPLVSWFKTFIEQGNVDPSVINNVHARLLKIFPVNVLLEPDDFKLGRTHNLRLDIAEAMNPVFNEFLKVIQNKEFDEQVNKFLGTNNVRKNYQSIIDQIQLINNSDLLDAVRRDEIPASFFITERIGANYRLVIRNINTINVRIRKVNEIMSDINWSISKNFYYYIPQIYLPTLIAELFYMVKDVNDFEQNMSKVGTVEYDAFVDITDPTSSSLVAGQKKLTQNVNMLIKNSTQFVARITEYHNKVVDFINRNNSYALLSKKGTNVFDNNLPMINVPTSLSENLANDKITATLQKYTINAINFYAGAHIPIGNILPLSSFDFANDKYRDMLLTRTGIISNVPAAGDNNQLNVIPGPNYIEVQNSIAGEFLDYVPAAGPGIPGAGPETIRYKDAFIAFLENDFDIDAIWATGMPLSIKSLLDDHIKLVKQEILERTITYYNQPANQIGFYPKLKNIALGDAQYTKLSDIPTLIVIGQVTDKIIIDIIDFAVKKSVIDWVYNKVNNFKYNIPEIPFFKQNDYLQMVLNSVEKKALENILTQNKTYANLEFQMSHVEQQPTQLDYATKDDPFIHYLYDIDYFSENSSNTNAKKCYNINPAVVKQSITSDTINSKNSDGETPLHLAVEMGHPQLVKLLVDNGAVAIKNNEGKTPLDTIIQDLSRHLNFLNENPIKNALEKFSKPFNDVLISRLRNEKFNNNIIKNITLGVPIQIAMYNHMFYIYTENYRYNITSELKDKIKRIISNVSDKNNIYPVDLYQVGPNDPGLNKIISTSFGDNLEKMAASDLKDVNQRKISKFQKEIEIIQNQIDGLTKEKDSKPLQIPVIDSAIAALNVRKGLISNKIKNIEIVLPQDDDMENDLFKSFYMRAVQNIVDTVESRESSFTLTNFYENSFDKISKGTNRVYDDSMVEMNISIWENYFSKDILNTPSLIFFRIGYVLERYLQTDPRNNKENITVIADYMAIVKDYIELRNNLPRSLDDNPILAEQRDQLIYLINLIITPAIKNIILRQIYNSIQKSDATNILIKNDDFSNNVLGEILQTRFNNTTLDMYLNNILPKRAIKFYTKIYDNSNDPEQKITNDKDLLIPILNIIKSVKMIIIDDNHIFVENFNNYLAPFILNTYQNFINTINMTVFGYERYLLHTYQLVTISNRLM